MEESYVLKKTGASLKEREKLRSKFQLEFIDVDNQSLMSNSVLLGIIKCELSRSREIFYKNGAIFEERSRTETPALRKNLVLDGVTRKENIEKYNIVAVFLGKDQFPSRPKLEDIIPIMHQCIAGCQHPAPIYDIRVNGIDLRQADGNRAEFYRKIRKEVIKKQLFATFAKYFRVGSYFDHRVKRVGNKDLSKKLLADIFVKVNGRKVILNRAGDLLCPVTRMIRAKQVSQGKLFACEGIKYYFDRRDESFRSKEP